MLRIRERIEDCTITGSGLSGLISGMKGAQSLCQVVKFVGNGVIYCSWWIDVDGRCGG